MYEGIRHQCGFSDCYCLNEKELRINLHTNLTVIYVKLVCEDPYICGTDTSLWDGEPREMLLSQELYNEKNLFSNGSSSVQETAVLFHNYF